MLKKAILFHLIPILISILISITTTYSVVSLYSKKEKHSSIKGTQQMIKGHYSNLKKGRQAEIDFISSIKNDKQLTIFGSSEFSDSPFCPYNYLPDSLGIQSMGLGHEYHQNLSILCELLATDEYLKNSNICVILSLSWFESKGTNTSAFLEFVRPLFFNKIVQNKNIKLEYKKHIGQYIYKHQNEIEGITNDMGILKDIYLLNSNNLLHKIEAKYRRYLRKIVPSESFSFDLELIYSKPKKQNGDLSLQAKKLQKEFISTTTSNNLFVYDEYYTKYLIDENGKERRGSTSNINLDNNNELNDFFLLVKYLNSKAANCSFVIQPLNPYYYDDLHKYNGLVNIITKVLDKYKIPYLNMHVSKKSNYEPGTLKDIMHLGDYGWIEVNSFLKKIYHEN